MSREVQVEGLFNARDLGGLPLRNGATTPSDVFIRADQPDLLTDQGWSELQERGLRTVVDLRQPGERSKFRAHLPAMIADLHVDHDGLDEHPEFWADYWDNGLVATPLYYSPHLAALPERTTAVLAAIASAPPGGVLFHCAAGRDRTGIITAVLLRAAGVEDDAIIADYLESITNADRLATGRGRPNAEATITDLLASHNTTSEAAMRRFLAHLDIDRLLAPLPAEHATAIRTWRGALHDQTTQRKST